MAMQEARQGKARQGKARQGKANQGKARQGKARQGKARQGKARQGKAKLLQYIHEPTETEHEKVSTSSRTGRREWRNGGVSRCKG